MSPIIRPWVTNAYNLAIAEKISDLEHLVKGYVLCEFRV